MKRVWKNIFATLVLLAGMGMLLYPYVSNYLAQQREANVIAGQNSAVNRAGSQTIKDALAKARDYNELLARFGAAVTDPFNAGSKSDGTRYKDLLNVTGDGVMGTLYIPSIGFALPIYHTTSKEVLSKGIGHLEGSSLPVGGKDTHCVLSGHTGLPGMKVFDDIRALKKGDYFVIRTLNEDFAYEVTSIEVVLPNQVESLSIQKGKDMVTLVTCTPYGINSHRLLVHAERIDLPAEWTKGLSDDGTPHMKATIWTLLESVMPFTLIGLAIVIGAIIGRRRVKRHISRVHEQISTAKHFKK